MCINKKYVLYKLLIMGICIMIKTVAAENLEYKHADITCLCVICKQQTLACVSHT